MSNFLLGSYLAALGLYLWARPAWRHVGPSLLDSFVLGLLLFASGSVAVWFEGLTDSETVMRIGVAAALSGTLGSSVWAAVFRRRIAGSDFFRTASRLRAGSGDRFAITFGLAFATLVSTVFLAAVFAHPHIGPLLWAAVAQGKGTLNEARILISAGTEGYFAPGYVKQFRDVLVPILGLAAVLCHGTYPYRWLYYCALAVALAAVFISGQRLVVVQFVLCFGCVFAMDFFSAPGSRFVPLKIAVPMLIAMIGLVGVMTEMLGRLDMALSPTVHQAEAGKAESLKQELREATEKFEAVSSALTVEDERLNALSAGAAAQDRKAGVAPNGATDTPADSSGVRQQIRNGIRDLEIEKAEIQRQLNKAREAERPPAQVSDTLAASGIPRPVAAVISLAHRAIIAVPRENTITYGYWASRSPAIGAGWITDLSGLRPGTQSQLSNELSQASFGGPLGNSPLGLATDIYYNWGWMGVAMVPGLCALGLLLLDLMLVESGSALLFAAKIFMFFSVPVMYSPFMFVLYGGAVVLVLAGYVMLLRKREITFVGLDA